MPVGTGYGCDRVVLGGCRYEHTGRAEVPHVAPDKRGIDISASQTYALVRSGELKGIQIGGRNQWRVERVMLEEFLSQENRRTRQQLDQLPDDPPVDT